MPNWCENEITLTGNKEVIEKLYNTAKNATKENGFFNQLIPRPEEIENQTEWNSKNWGTKWDIDLEDYFKITEVVGIDGRYTFSIGVGTAWSPPEQFLETLCSQLDISGKIRFIEGGMDFCGIVEYNGKEKVKEIVGDITRKNLEKAGFDEGYISDIMENYEEDEE